MWCGGGCALCCSCFCKVSALVCLLQKATNRGLLRFFAPKFGRCNPQLAVAWVISYICVCACVSVCVCACVRACVCVCLCLCLYL